MLEYQQDQTRKNTYQFDLDRPYSTIAVIFAVAGMVVKRNATAFRSRNQLSSASTTAVLAPDREEALIAGGSSHTNWKPFDR